MTNLPKGAILGEWPTVGKAIEFELEDNPDNVCKAVVVAIDKEQCLFTVLRWEFDNILQQFSDEPQLYLVRPHIVNDEEVWSFFIPEYVFGEDD